MEHQYYMQQVLERFKDFKFYIILNKCKFDIEEIEFLGFMILIKRIRMNSKRIQMIEK